ncbi:nuclear poly(A) polymerase 1 [Podospora fimiseda]|uniref:polynucleotide adenylyltransferase n=1 Tax=Podospora fimiseda TaxID=252190 RepID=A0AAN7H7M2_9PEZI|nr:nuclear poly(A) polymerase 1 [Podospora fimiseda]
MATTDTTTTEPSFTLTSHNTALAIIPPSQLWAPIDHLRCLYDKAYVKWPPHINLLYPFIPPTSLELLSSTSLQPSSSPFNLTLDTPGVFEHKHSNTIYLTCSSLDQQEKVKELRRDILQGLGVVDGGGGQQQFKMHLSVAQTDDSSTAAHKFLIEKVKTLPLLEWEVKELVILKRERDAERGGDVMKLWGKINIVNGEVTKLGDGEKETFYSQEDIDEAGAAAAKEMKAVYYDEELCRWVSFYREDLLHEDDEDNDENTLKISSYNVLAEFEYPPPKKRYQSLVANILSSEAEADILILQEVTDHFLDYLLSDSGIQDKYPYSSHGPPSQDDCLPLQSFLNVVVLSNRPFGLESFTSLRRKHKGAVIIRFFVGGGGGKEVVLGGVHLTRGLNDGAVVAKKGDITKLIGVLEKRGEKNKGWVIVGDFNLPSSKESIKVALEKGNISENTIGHLRSLEEEVFEAAGWEDVGKEEGKVTWDPEINGLAKGLSEGNEVWPQRYDRVYVRGGGVLKVVGFNLFGNIEGEDGGGFASDHWGVRCVLEVGEFDDYEEEEEEKAVQQPSGEINKLVVPVEFQEANGSLAEAGSVDRCLTELSVIPGEEETEIRKGAFELLKSVILDTWATDSSNPKSQPAVVVVPVGSYALGVWTSASDIDVLVIGPFTAHTFFSLASKRLRKAAAQGIKILRRVRANTGTMLELEVSGIRMDLQFCPATSVAKRWPEVLKSPASDPVWSLHSQTLNKLKAIRDIDHIQRTIPCLPTFQLAHRLIKTWAKSRGIYTARFGFLSGIQIALLLSRLYKLLSLTHPSPTNIPVESLLTTFFAHYSTFPFSTHQAFDPTFHTTRIPYTRVPSREPLAILGYFPPMLNTAASSSIPSLRTLTNELLLAHQSLSSSPSTTWKSFLLTPPQTPFLTQYKSYISLSLQYWSLSPTKGLSYLNWFESRCVSLLVDLNRRAPLLHARIWPARFIEQSELQNPDEDTLQGRAYRGCYLIGLDKLPESSSESLKPSLAALRNILPRFEDSIKRDTKYFDPSTKWFSATLINQSDLAKMDLVVDKSEWAETNAGEDDSDSDEDSEEEEQQESYSQEEEADGRQEGESWESAKRLVAIADLRTDKTKKFRTASDVINRIRWDASLDSGDFVVGYEDRFLGAQEKELDEWKGEQTDEEFIPQHRILYFKRKSDGRIVWDRRTRWDEIFEN